VYGFTEIPEFESFPSNFPCKWSEKQENQGVCFQKRELGSATKFNKKYENNT
jgi:hypothetical protein